VHCIGHGLSSITTADAHTSPASSRLNWHPRRFKWTRPFRWKTKSGFCACAITFRFCSTCPLYERADHVMQFEQVCLLVGESKINPCTNLDRPRGFQEVEAPTFRDNRHMNVVRLSALRTCRLYPPPPPGNIPGTHFC